jgi:NAD-dependent deacetylase
VPFELDRIYGALDQSTLFVAIGTSGVVEPAASFVAHVAGRARTIYVGPEEPANASSFTECYCKRERCCPTCSVPCERRLPA